MYEIIFNGGMQRDLSEKIKRNANLYEKGEMIGRIEKEFTYYACVTNKFCALTVASEALCNTYQSFIHTKTAILLHEFI